MSTHAVASLGGSAPESNCILQFLELVASVDCRNEQHSAQTPLRVGCPLGLIGASEAPQAGSATRRESLRNPFGYPRPPGLLGVLGHQPASRRAVFSTVIPLCGKRPSELKRTEGFTPPPADRTPTTPL